MGRVWVNLQSQISAKSNYSALNLASTFTQLNTNETQLNISLI